MFKVQPEEILRNRGIKPDTRNPLWRREMLIQVGDRKAWVVAEGATHEEATENVYVAAEAQKRRWATPEEPSF